MNKQQKFIDSFTPFRHLLFPCETSRKIYTTRRHIRSIPTFTDISCTNNVLYAKGRRTNE